MIFLFLQMVEASKKPRRTRTIIMAQTNEHLLFEREKSKREMWKTVRWNRQKKREYRKKFKLLTEINSWIENFGAKARARGNGHAPNDKKQLQEKQ